MPITTSNFGALLAPGLRQIWGDKYNEYPEEYSKFCNVVTSNRNYEEDHSITSLGLVPIKDQGAGVKYDTIYDGITKRYTHTSYGLGFTVTREMYEDILYTNTIIKKMPGALARSNAHTIEIIAAALLNNAFSTSYLGADGVALCHTAHPLLNATVANRPTIDADLDVTSFENALIQIESDWVDGRGLKIRAIPKKIIVHPSEQFQLKMLLKSASLPDTANNNINPLADISMDMVTLHWLTSPSAWFIATDIPDGPTFMWRRKPDFTQDTDPDSQNAKFITTFRCSTGWTDPLGIWGTSGA